MSEYPRNDRLNRIFAGVLSIGCVYLVAMLFLNATQSKSVLSPNYNEENVSNTALAGTSLPPIVTSITAPVEGSVVSGTTTIAVSVSTQTTIKKVTFLVAGVPIGEKVSHPYAIQWNTVKNSNGRKALVAVAEDSQGRYATSSPVSANVQNHKTTLFAPAANATVRGIIDLAAVVYDSSGIEGVQFYIAGNRVEGLDTTVPYSVQWNTSQNSNGAKAVLAVTKDKTGNYSTSSPITVYVDNKLPTMPPVVWDHIGIAQNMTRDATSSVDRANLAKADYVWGAQTATDTPAYSTAYLPYDRDYDLTLQSNVDPPELVHDYAWYLANGRADWIAYTCDSAGNPVGPVEYTKYPYGYLVTLNIDNEKVRQYVLNTWITQYLTSGYAGIAFDNMLPANRHGYCGVKDEQGNFTREFLWPTQRVDQAYTDSRVNWLKWMSDHIHALGGSVSINLAFDDRNPDSFDAISARADIVLVEQGFASPTAIHYPTYANEIYGLRCTPLYLDQSWLLYFKSLSKIARERALVLYLYACNKPSDLLHLSEGEPTASITTWDVANYLLVRGKRTYVTFLSNAFLYRKYYDTPELSIPIGAPTSEPQQIPGTFSWVRYYANGLAIVNPSSTASTTLTLPPGSYRDLKGNIITGGITLSPSRMGKDIDPIGGIHTVPVFGSAAVLLKVK